MSEKESVITRSNLKDKIKRRTDLRSGEAAVDNLVDLLDRLAVRLIDAAGDNVREKERKTILARDIVEAERVVLQETAPRIGELVDVISSLSAQEMLKLAEAIRAAKKGNP